MIFINKTKIKMPLRLNIKALLIKYNLEINNQKYCWFRHQIPM